MVASGGRVDTTSSAATMQQQQPREVQDNRIERHELMRVAGSIMLVAALALAMVATANFYPETEELLSSHHLRRAYMIEHSAEQADNERLSELSRLAAAADEQAQSTSSLKEQEESKLKTSPSSKVDAETMLSNEARKKSDELYGKVSSSTCCRSSAIC